jgi:hypothetical protein
MVASLFLTALFIFNLGMSASGFLLHPLSCGHFESYNIPGGCNSVGRLRSLRDGSSSSISNSNTSLAAKTELSRTLFLSDALALASFIAVVSPPNPAFAADDSAAKKGTKEDPKFQACLSLCMYDCTKPKGVEQRSRSECLPECKQKCATTKQQLLLGTPKD